jgi:aminopeptidase-like protein
MFITREEIEVKVDSLQSLFHELLKELHPRDYSIVSSANDEMASLLEERFGFSSTEYKSQKKLNGWEIPQGWKLREFALSCQGEILFDLSSSEVVVSNLSPNMDCEISYEELISHIVLSEDKNLQSIAWDWRNLYKTSQDVDWSISMTRKSFQKLDKAKRFRILIDAEHFDSSMKVLEKDSLNNSHQTVIVNAHNCHPYQFNDDLSGVIGAVLLQEVAKEMQINTNIKSLICPELYGPLYWLNQVHESKVSDGGSPRGSFKGCLVLASIASQGALKVQQSFNIDSLLNFAAVQICKNNSLKTYSFRELHGNDEIVFECPPFSIPTVTLTRFPFQTYHTFRDNPNKRSWIWLRDALVVALEILVKFDNQKVYNWDATGLPKYDTQKNQKIFKKSKARNISRKAFTSQEKRFAILMSSLPMAVRAGFSVEQIAGKYGLPLKDVENYLKLFEDVGYLSVGAKERTKIV